MLTGRDARILREQTERAHRRNERDTRMLKARYDERRTAMDKHAVIFALDAMRLAMQQALSTLDGVLEKLRDV